MHSNIVLLVYVYMTLNKSMLYPYTSTELVRNTCRLIFDPPGKHLNELQGLGFEIVTVLKSFQKNICSTVTCHKLHVIVLYYQNWLKSSGLRSQYLQTRIFSPSCCMGTARCVLLPEVKDRGQQNASSCQYSMKFLDHKTNK